MTTPAPTAAPTAPSLWDDPEYWYTQLSTSAYTVLVGFVSALFTLLLGYAVARCAASSIFGIAKKRKLENMLLADFGASCVKIVVMCIAIISALGHLGISTASMVAVFGAATAAVSLSAYSSLSHFVAGIMLLSNPPFAQGDEVRIADTTGHISGLSMFSTTVVTRSNELVVLPNSFVLSNPVTNYTKRDKTTRVEVAFGVAYGSDLRRVAAVAAAAAAGCPAVLANKLATPRPEVLFVAMAASALNFVCYAWANTRDRIDATHQVRWAIYHAFEDEGIAIPFDQLVVHRINEQLAAEPAHAREGAPGGGGGGGGGGGDDGAPASNNGGDSFRTAKTPTDGSPKTFKLRTQAHRSFRKPLRAAGRTVRSAEEAPRWFDDEVTV